MRKEELLQEVNELIHDYPCNYPSEVRNCLRHVRDYLNPEPRVLMVEELEALPSLTIVWVEFHSGPSWDVPKDEIKAAFKCFDGSLVDEDTCVHDNFERDTKPDPVGDCWRYWLGHPNEEQRKAVPWE